jgi:hypothetical protein
VIGKPLQEIKFGEGSLMVWGCIGWNRVEILAEVEGRMDAKQYVSILENNLLSTMKNSGIPKEDIIF